MTVSAGRFSAPAAFCRTGHEGSSPAAPPDHGGSRMSIGTRIAVVTAALATAAVVAVPAFADTGNSSDNDRAHCARAFDQAQRTDMESFRDFDKATWLAGHDDDAITIFTTGQM